MTASEESESHAEIGSKPRIFESPNLTKQELLKLNPGDIIKQFPMSTVIEIFSSRIPDATAAKANAYGEVGGDLIQHGRMRALRIMAEDMYASLEVKSVNQENESIRAEVTLPDTPQLPAENFWGFKQKTITIPFSKIKASGFKRFFKAITGK
jgi:hypothetical protein